MRLIEPPIITSPEVIIYSADRVGYRKRSTRSVVKMYAVHKVKEKQSFKLTLSHMGMAIMLFNHEFDSLLSILFSVKVVFLEGDYNDDLHKINSHAQYNIIAYSLRTDFYLTS